MLPHNPTSNLRNKGLLQDSKSFNIKYNSTFSTTPQRASREYDFKLTMLCFPSIFPKSNNGATSK